ncbi:guanylate kinase [Tuberibacillus calidus]|jgi:guanylate kinase|uniref:guanylate kinase n=1 Tax=Tuberibacillus calidus TaxID=340097 RepID=UPI000424CBD8|nr:guanylate kinase [Tuberibacillus calidus]
MTYKEKGLLFILSGPSGVGKGTVCKALKKRKTNLAFSVSATTRKPREGEREGVEYFFKTREQFEQMIKDNLLLEWAEYVGNYYGTPLDFVEKTLDSGKDVLLEIEVQGAMKVKKNYPNGIFIFLAPPSLGELRRRITGRGTESEDIINGRMTVAKAEIEMMKHYDYVIENDEVERACDRIEAVVMAEHLRRARVMEKYLQLMEGEGI